MFKSMRNAALREWRDLLVAWHLLVREYRRRVRIRLTAPPASRLNIKKIEYLPKCPAVSGALRLT
jgi:hypothetical protein